MKRAISTMIPLIAILGGFLVIPRPVAAADPGTSIECVGTYCDAIPYSPEDYDAILYEFDQQYAKLMFNDMAEAMAMANIASIPQVGTINLHGFTIGAGLGLAYRTMHYVDINVPHVGEYNDLPVAGIGIMPRIYAGVNLGWITGNGYDPYSDDPEEIEATPGYLSLSRVDLFVSGMKYGKEYESDRIKGKIKANFDSLGVQLNYHVFDGNGIILGPLLRFRGLSIGAGAYRNSQEVEYTTIPDTMRMDVSEGTTVSWDGTNSLHWKAKIETYPVEVNTGLQLFYLLNLTLGGGVAWHKGSTEFTLLRTGPITADTTLFNGTNYAIPADLLAQLPPDAAGTLNGTDPASLALPEAQALMTLRIRGKGEVPRYTPYGKVGVELNIVYLKIYVAAMITQRTYGAQIGARVEI